MEFSQNSKAEVEKIKAYAETIKEEFNREWENTKFKWFFKKKRKSKIKNNIYKKYKFQIFDSVSNICDIEIPIKIEETIAGFTEFTDTE
jgi:hypothetical protein